MGSGLLLPLVVRYENKELSIYANGFLLASSPVQPGYDIWIPRLMGGDGAVWSGFQGQVAEWLFYNRALSEYERGLVEQYVITRYQMESSESSSSEESSMSSEESSWSSSEESSWSSVESSMESSWESSMESSGETSSGTSGYVPDPVPITSGLVAWQRSDLNVSKDMNNQVAVWGSANNVLPAAQRVTFTGPAAQENVFGNQPALLFSGIEGLSLQAGNLGTNSFTLLVVGCPASQAWDQGVLLGSDNQPGAVAEISASQAQVQVSEPGGSPGTRLQASTFGCLCPATVVYENKQARLYWLGVLVDQSTSTPPYDVLIPKLIGGPGAGGFMGSVAEVLIYNRALSDSERQQVEAYLVNRYQCWPSWDSSEESSGEPSSSVSSEEESSESSSSSSSSESESGEGDSSESSGQGTGIYFSPGFLEFFNPTATDWDWQNVSIVNHTGTPVASLEFYPISGGSGGIVAAGDGFEAAQAGDVVEITSNLVNPSTVGLMVQAWGPPTPYGIAGLSWNTTFKDSNGSVIGSSLLSADVLSSRQGALEQSKEKSAFDTSYQLAVSGPFNIKITESDFYDQSAGWLAEQTVIAKLQSEQAQLKIKVAAAIGGLDNISVQRIVGQGDFQIQLLDIGNVSLSGVGDFKATWSPGSTNHVQLDWGAGLQIERIDNTGVVFGMNLQVLTESRKETIPGWFAISFVRSQGKRTLLRLSYAVPN